MDFEYSERTKAAVGMVTEFVEKELLPLEGELLARGMNALMPQIREKQKKVKQMGLWAPCFPKELGGLGLKVAEFAPISEALGRSPLGHYVFWCQAPDVGNVEILHRYGTAEQKKKYLEPLIAGEIRSCFSMTEPEMPGSNPVMLETSAKKDGDDYVINGQKWFTSSADGAEFAIVMAVTNPDQAPHLRASMIIVPTNNPGFNRVRNISIMGHAGEGYASHAEVLYQSCRVPVTNRLGGEGLGFAIAQDRLGPGRIHHCMRWIGICRRSLDLLCQRAVTRKIDEEGRTLATRQVIQTWVAECEAEIQAARLMTLHAAWKIDTVGAKAARHEISAIKFTVANTMQKIIDRSLQVHGGLGMTDDTILSYYWRHERAARIYDGADEVHKTSLGKRILDEYKKKAL